MFKLLVFIGTEGGRIHGSSNKLIRREHWTVDLILVIGSIGNRKI